MTSNIAEVGLIKCTEDPPASQDSSLVTVKAIDCKACRLLSVLAFYWTANEVITGCCNCVTVWLWCELQRGGTYDSRVLCYCMALV